MASLPIPIPIPIIILNWNNFKDTEECVESILNAEVDGFEIFLIDNFSDTQERNALIGKYQNHTKVNLILHNKNWGFAKAHNLIFESLLEQDYPFLFLLNNDTYIEKESLEFIKAFRFTDDYGMLTFKMINYWKRDLMDNAGHQMLSSGEIIPIGHLEPIDEFNTSFQNVGACAGATLYNTKMLRDIGLFDEYFETGYEDAELGLRAIIAGYKSEFNPKAIVYHKMGQSIKKVFNYHYSLKIQTNIFYTYLKLMPWQIIGIQIIPFIIRYFIIILIDIIFWRPKYLKIQLHSLFIILFKDLGKVLKARKAVKQLRNINWWKLLCLQDFFLKRDIRNFNKFIIKGEKSYFEK